MQDIHAAAKLVGSSKQGLIWISGMLTAIGEPEEALILLDRAIDIYPDEVILYQNRFKIRERLGNHLGALFDAIEIDKRSPNALMMYHSAPLLSKYRFDDVVLLGILGQLRAVALTRLRGYNQKPGRNASTLPDDVRLVKLLELKVAEFEVKLVAVHDCICTAVASTKLAEAKLAAKEEK